MNLTPEQLAEQSGSVVASRMIEAMRREQSQAERFAILRDAICDVAPDAQAIGGFSAVLVAQLELSMGIK